MANFDFVQQKVGAVTGTSGTVTLDSTPTVGNTIIVRIAHADAAGTVPKVTGFRPTECTYTANGSSIIYYRHVKSGDSATITCTQGVASSMAVHAAEYVGRMVPHRSQLNAADNTNVMARSTGTTPATTTAAALVIAGVATRNITSTTHAFTNSFTLRTVATAGSGASGRTMIPGDLVVSSTGTYETTASWAVLNERAWGLITAFIIAAEETDGAYITAVKADTPFSLYRFHHDVVGMVPDEMNKYHLRLSTSGATPFQTGPVTVEPNNYGMLFDGVAGIADTKTNVTSNIDTVAAYAGDTTFEVWVSVPDPTQGGTGVFPAFTSRSTDAHGTFALPCMASNDGKWYCHYRNNAVVGTTFDTGLNVPTDTWELFWITFNSAGMKVYNVQGGVVTQLGSAQTDITQGNFDMHRFAKNQGTGFTNIRIANAAIWHSVLTTTQMQAHYDATVVVSTDTAYAGSIPI